MTERTRSVKPTQALCLATACLTGVAVSAQTDSSGSANPFGRLYPPRIYTAARIESAPPLIDGRLDDPAWKEGLWSGDYVQQIPAEGAKPSQPTELKILYDTKNIYAAVRAYDVPEKISRFYGRRDAFLGDIVGVCFDSDFDRRTGFEFDLTAAGGKIDLILMNDGWDPTWDAVWDGKTALEDDAWTAEFRIPLSQLRYGPQDEQVWGLHAWRWIDRHQEEDQWNLIPRKSTGRMYNLGELHGIRGLKRFRHVELLPHVLSKLDAFPRAPGDPYRTGPALFGSTGLDAKIGLSTDLTLDATINPDFGQVEADPSVMNLTAYETFYQEKRPFFLEGKNILSFNVHGGRLFYSRRIGHAPTYSPELRDDEFIRTPDISSILGAVKITGKTSDGLSLGLVQSLSARETARMSFDGAERRQAVEPLTNHFIARAQKDWNKGNTSLGAIFTATHRRIKDPALDFMARDAITAGLDFVRYFGNRQYVLDAKAVVSRVAGGADAMRELQKNAVHYYQRPDASHLGVKQDAAALFGHGGVLRFERHGNSKWRFAESLSWISPGLDLNDLGYLRQADLIRNAIWIEYEETEPRGIFRDYELDFERTDAWDFGGLRTDAVTSLHARGLFKNRWGVSLAADVVQAPVSTRLLRGGPAMKLSSYLQTSFIAHTDSSRRTSFYIRIAKDTHANAPNDNLEIYPSLSLRLSNALSLSAEVGYARNTDDLQYVETVQTDAAARYVLGRMRQKTLSTTIRASFHVTPELSIEYYGSPFVSIGRYTDFKLTTRTLARRYEDRFRRFGADEIGHAPEGNEYEIRETSGATYSFANPDFSFRQFRSNCVLRWEYKPGSSLYVVWSQGRTSESDLWEASFRRNYDALWKADAENVFLVKLSYWFSI
jgi:hypothetical protein